MGFLSLGFWWYVNNSTSVFLRVGLDLVEGLGMGSVFRDLLSGLNLCLVLFPS
jgi:hypothetical protein